MPSWPIPPGRRCITIELPAEHVQHLDDQARYLGCTRAAYLRQLIVRDLERQAPAPANA
jgi:predicted DNA-binding protein